MKQTSSKVSGVADTKENITHSRMNKGIIEYMQRVEAWLSENPEWKSPRGGVWVIIRNTSGKRGLLPYRIAYKYMGILWKVSPIFRGRLENRGVRWS